MRGACSFSSAWSWSSSPGDFTLRMGNATLYVPIATSIVLSVVLTVVLNLVFRQR